LHHFVSFKQVEKNYNPLVIKATDADTGVNSLLSYEILEERAKKFFAIDESTGALRSITALDYEEQKIFKFNVRVSDRGSPSLSSDKLARVTIEVLDENDSAPFFEKKIYNVVLLLPTFKDVLVAQVNATDPDVGIKTQLR
jgi:protocadherin Fat 1/2/3